MIGQGGQSWATTLADLSIILFMITAADLAQAGPAAEADAAHGMVASAEPVAVYRPAPGAPALGAWLASQPQDDRQQLTIVVTHSGSEPDAAVAEGLKLAAEAESAGREPRLIIERSERSGVAAILAYDAVQPQVAR